MALRFTVVTVVFNAGDVLAKTMESVLYQSYLPYEYIVVDGKSTDETLKIVESYRNCFESSGVVFKVISEKDSGIYNAMNKGIKAATGDFISFLNAGDWYELDALSKIDSFYEEEAFDLTYGGLHYIKPDGTITNKMSKLDRFPITSRHWNHPSMFLRREIYQDNCFDESFRAYADFDLYLKLRKSDIRIRVIDEIITNFVADGISTKVDRKSVVFRAKEKYAAYRNNGYSRIYFLESYGWECLKALYFKMHHAR